MAQKILIAITLCAFMMGAQAAWIGGGDISEKEKQTRLLEERCAQDHSIAYCTMWANKIQFNLQDVDFPVAEAQFVKAQDKTGQITAGVAGIAVGASQLNGSAPTIGSRFGMGSINILASLLEMSADYSQTVSDRMIGYLPQPDYVLTSEGARIFRLGHGSARKTATTSLGTIAAKSERRLKRYCASAR